MNTSIAVRPGDGKNRTRPSTPFYRALMQAIDARRQELGLSMHNVDEMAGFAEYYFAKFAYPDTPNGRQAGWETINETVLALFGNGYEITIAPGTMRKQSLTVLSERTNPSTSALQVRHWRHSRHFKELGRKGGKARMVKMTKRQRVAVARKANRASQRARKAKRQGEAHRAANAAGKERT